ncbi:MAG: hypothetical protein HY360_21140 [Verrucomicrobia bacterium]|nr:hypothetical protein [Verrucomicrobiota bacterium]
MKTQARFQIDQNEYLRQFETVFLRPIEKGYDAVAVGNGDLAAIVWQPGHLTWMLNKCNLSGEASQAARLVFETPVPLAQRIGRLETRLSLAEATVAVKYTGGELGGWDKGGWRGRFAPTPVIQDIDRGSLDVTGYVPDGCNVLLIEYAEAPAVPHPTTIRWERWRQAAWGDDARVEVSGNTAAIIYQESCSPARLGHVWYGAREGVNCHSTTFPLW